MLYSEAIRLGGMWNEQCQGSMIDKHGRRCVQGAALHAIGYPDHVLRNNTLVAKAHLEDVWPYLKTIVIEEDDDDESINTFTRYIFKNRVPLLFASECLNDHANWTLARIADWVEGIERKHGVIEELAKLPTTCVTEIQVKVPN